jgi:putative aldouronate transport system permease protein
MKRQKEIWQDVVFGWVTLILAVIILFMTLYPVYLIVISSVSNANLVSLGQVTLYTKGFTLDGYEALFMRGTIWRPYLNSVIYTFSGTLLSIAVTMCAAFALSTKFPGKRIVSLFFVFTMFFSGGLIPTFLVVRDVGLYNSPLACIILGCVSVWNVMLARTYISSTIPDSLYEAAILDGASILKYFLNIVLPLSGTIIAVLSVYYGVSRWNDYWTGLVYIQRAEYLPLQTVLRGLLASLQTNQELTFMAGASTEDMSEILNRANIAKYCIIVVSTVPAVVLYLFMQKFFVKGVMIGSIKG